MNRPRKDWTRAYRTERELRRWCYDDRDPAAHALISTFGRGPNDRAWKARALAVVARFRRNGEAGRALSHLELARSIESEPLP